MQECCIDVETRSATPIRHGTDNYTATAECLIVTWTLDDGLSQIWDRASGDAMPDELDWILDDASDVTLVAHKAGFDRRIITRSLKRPTDIHRWRCTQAQAYSHGLPGSLNMLGQVLDLPLDERKLTDDKGLIKVFCIPHSYAPNGAPLYYTAKDKPAEWARFCAYAKQDVVALREIRRRLPTHNYQGENLRLWHLDQRINERGFGFDAELALAARELLAKAKGKHDAQASDMTGGAVTAATQRAKLLSWLEQSGLALPNMQAATIRDWLEHDDLRPEQRFMLELRLEAAKSAGSKYRRGLEVMGDGSRIRDAIQFSGAGRTGRFSGRGFQPHNMTRPTTSQVGKDGKAHRVPVKAGYIMGVIVPGIKAGKVLDNPLLYGGPNEACANALRSAIVAGPGNELIVADWSNIESRILAWIADEEWKLAAYRAVDQGEGVDLYKLLFHNFFGTPLDQIDDNQRQSGKVSELAFGFGGGVGALVTMAATYEIDLDTLAPMVLPNASSEHRKKARTAWRRAFLRGEDYGLEPATYMACDILKQVYRASNARINSLRHEVDDATKSAVKQPGVFAAVTRCQIWSTGSWLIVQLPSGRRLLYAQPKIEVTRETDPDTGKVSVYESISYMTARGQQWRRESAWSGLFIENIVQAIANDVLRAALLLIDDEMPGSLSLHVHDEVTCELPIGKMKLERLIKLITTKLVNKHAWMRGLPLAANGWVGPRYHSK